jgi:hypothetical protein
MSRRLIHVSAEGATWSLTAAAWRQLVRARATGNDDIDIDAIGRRLARKTSVWIVADHHQIDRWCLEDWTEEFGLMLDAERDEK